MRATAASRSAPVAGASAEAAVRLGRHGAGGDRERGRSKEHVGWRESANFGRAARHSVSVGGRLAPARTTRRPTICASSPRGRCRRLERVVGEDVHDAGLRDRQDPRRRPVAAHVGGHAGRPARRLIDQALELDADEGRGMRRASSWAPRPDRRTREEAPPGRPSRAVRRPPPATRGVGRASQPLDRAAAASRYLPRLEDAGKRGVALGVVRFELHRLPRVGLGLLEIAALGFDDRELPQDRRARQARS